MPGTAERRAAAPRRRPISAGRAGESRRGPRGAASSSTASAASPTNGREYVIDPRRRASRRRRPGSTSSPIPSFGFQVAAEGSGYTWSRQQPRESAHAVVERSGQRPAGRGRSICATRTPASCGARPRCRSATTRRTYVARHGRGYSRFEHDAHGIALELLQFVPLDDPIKISRLTLRNTSGRAAAAVGHGLCRMGARPVARRVGAVRRRPRSMPQTGAMFARNPWNIGIRRARRVRRSWRPADRLDRRPRANSSAATARSTEPAALAGADAAVAARSGAGLDPCGALQTTIELDAGGDAEIVFLLGEAATPDEARSADRALPRRRSRRGACARSRDYWDDVLGAVQVKTPDRAMDIMLNGWLLYQTLACRIWARSALLPGERRLRLPRPAAGRHGAGAVAARP